MNGTLWKLALPALVWTLIGPAVFAETERASAVSGNASTAKVRRIKGDITAVNAGPGLTGGGISGDVTLNLVFFGSGSSDTVARGDHTHGFVGENTAVGAFALQNNGASGNTAVGQQSMQKNTSGSNNSALGNETLRENTGGSFNAAVGAHALKHNISGSFNAAMGADALSSNTAGDTNTATGAQALLNNDTGSSNTANGFSALSNNTFGSGNTANGGNALLDNTSGAGNTASGFNSLANNTTGNVNTAIGSSALANNTTGGSNTAIGNQALQNNTTGTENIALGDHAGVNITTGGGNIAIGHPGVANDFSTIRIGAGQSRTFIDGIRGTATDLFNAVPVVIDSAGQLGTASSSQRFKNDIKPMDQSSESILALRPVTFHYKSDNKATAQFGLIAEEVAQVNPDLVVRASTGEIYTVRYDAVNAMLLNEFLKEHHTVQDLKELAQKQQTAIVLQQQQIAALTAVVQKMSAKVQLEQAAGDRVADN